MSITTDIEIADLVPGQELFEKSLQRNLVFTINKKPVKKGKLLLFKKQHYHIVLTLLNSKGNQENFEIPMPFKMSYSKDGASVSFDYRIEALTGGNDNIETYLTDFRVKGTDPSHYLNNVLEISIL